MVLFFIVTDFMVAFVLRRGMEKYYGLDKNAKILCVGHSHTVLGLDAERMERELSVPVSKYAVSGANILDRFYMIQHFLEKNPDVHTVLYDVDARLFDSEGLSSASYTLFMPFMDNDSINQYIFAQATWQECLLGQAIKSSRFRDQSLNIAIRGLIGKTETIKKSTVNLNDYKAYLEREKERKIRIDSDSVLKFEETVKLLADRNIRVFLIFIPVIDRLNNIDITTQKKAVDIFSSVASSHENVVLLNYNSAYEHRHDLFFDLRHLNEKGKQMITGRIINDLNKVMLNQRMLVKQ